MFNKLNQFLHKSRRQFRHNRQKIHKLSQLGTLFLSLFRLITTNFALRDQLSRNRLLRALRTMKGLPNFNHALCCFILEETRREAAKNDGKDPPLASFNMDSLKNYSYQNELDKYEKNNPLLLAAIVGSISKEKVTDYSEVSRKGFGGPNSSSDVDLVPCVVQTISRILKNRHPRSVITTPCMNSLFLWANRVPGHVHFYNSLGDAYRSVINKF